MYIILRRSIASFKYTNIAQLHLSTKLSIQSNPILSYPFVSNPSNPSNPTLLYIVVGDGRYRPFMHFVLQSRPIIDFFYRFFFLMWWAKLHLYLCHFTDQIHYLLFYTPCFDLYERGAKIVVRVRVENYDVMLGKR